MTAATVTATPVRKPTVEHLDEMDVSKPLLSTEGVDINDLMRAKIHYLASQNAKLTQQFQFSDAKAATLLTLMGVIAANAPVSRSAVAPVEILFFVLIGLSLGLALWSVFPKLPSVAAREKIAEIDRFSWPGLTSDQFSAGDYANFMRDAQATHLLTSMARSNAVLSKILLRKFQLLRFSFILGAIGLSVLVLRLAWLHISAGTTP
ncbi:MAG: Pycsar system effector family protein [Pseudomonadota bacterium]